MLFLCFFGLESGHVVGNGWSETEVHERCRKERTVLSFYRFYFYWSPGVKPPKVYILLRRHFTLKYWFSGAVRIDGPPFSESCLFMMWCVIDCRRKPKFDNTTEDSYYDRAFNLLRDTNERTWFLLHVTKESHSIRRRSSSSFDSFSLWKLIPLSSTSPDLPQGFYTVQD